MRRLLAFTAVFLVLLPISAVAQEPIAHTPVGCIRGGEMAVLQMRIAEEGNLRCYFRRTNTTDWCSVEGINEGPLSRVTMPKFDTGDEIEYFFVLLDGQRISARSSRIYRSRVSDQCTTTWARHTIMLRISCGSSDENMLIPASLGAGYALNGSLVTSTPTYASPDRPTSTLGTSARP
ncbi:MAG: hypothetical protein WA208_12860 [Thermoanaerobaculia bacterium]